MKFAQLLSLVPLSYAVANAAEDAALSAAVAALPPCALTCMVEAMSHATCSLSDRDCTCTNAQFLNSVEACILSSCSFAESLSTKNITSTLCEAPIRYKSESTRLWNIILSVITVTIGLTRLFYNAIFAKLGWGWEDWTMLAVITVGAPSAAIVDRMSISNGLGKDVWTLSVTEIQTFAKSVYLLELLYFLEIALVKATLLLFYLKIFPGETTKRLIKATLWFNTLYGLTFFTVGVFPCQPIHHYWTKFGGGTNGHCVDINALVWTHAILSIVLDIWMLSLPVYEVLRMKLSWRKRVNVALMFFVGTFVTVVSIIRLRFLITFGKGNNPTWDQAGVVDWSNIEVNVGIICACMPTMRLILARFLPRFFVSTEADSVLCGMTRLDGIDVSGKQHAFAGSKTELANVDCESLRESSPGG